MTGGDDKLGLCIVCEVCVCVFENVGVWDVWGGVVYSWVISHIMCEVCACMMNLRVSERRMMENCSMSVCQIYVFPGVWGGDKFGIAYHV